MTTKTKLDNWMPATAAATTAGDKEPRPDERIVTISLRVAKKDWMRLRVMAMTEDLSLQDLGVAAMNLLLKEKGLPPLE